MRKCAIALLHHPVLGRNGEVLTTTLTNLDLHDMARSARAYGLEGFYIVHPLASQRALAERIVGHWLEGAGGRRIPDRARALEVVRIVADLDAVAADLGPLELWTTAARGDAGLTTFAEARTALEGEGPAALICFGTGWGLAPAVLEAAARQIEPIYGGRDSDFNHLSVRAACAITLDRLLGVGSGR